MRQRPPTDAELAEIRARLDRLDAASPIGPWTRQTLAIIDRSPEVRAPDLAAELGRDTPSFKRDVRKLKELGLTESLDIGYRLSPRGEAVVDDGGPPRERPAPPTGTRLPTIGAPATRALTAAGLTTLEAVAAVPEQELAAMHGVGPVALTKLRDGVGRARPRMVGRTSGTPVGARPDSRPAHECGATTADTPGRAPSDLGLRERGGRRL